MEKYNEIKVKSLKKALEILECFLEKKSLGVTEISEKMDLYKSNVHNILTTFAAMDYLEQDSETGKYRLGPAAAVLGRAYYERLNIVNLVAPFARDIANEVGEKVYLSIPRGNEVLYLDAYYPEGQRMWMEYVTGECAKMYYTGVGKAFLAQMKEEEAEECIREEIIPITNYTITDKDVLRQEIQRTKELGYGLDNMELSFGSRCIGVALINSRGIIEAGLSISASSLRMTDENISDFAEVLKKYARKIEQML